MGLRDVVVGAVAAGSVVAAPIAASSLRDTAASTGIPQIALEAYTRAAAGSSCGVRWQDIAAVGAVESGHGTHGGAHLLDDGTISKPIGSWAGAEGPMQFMPDTWRWYATNGFGDGNGDGVADVNNIFDAAPATAEYLCRSGYDVNDHDSVVNAWGAYNGGANWRGKSESEAYVELAAAYADELPGAGVIEGGSAGTSEPQAAADPTLAGRAEAAWSAMLKRWDSIGGLVDRPDTPTLRALWQGADKTLTGRSGKAQASSDVELLAHDTGVITDVSGIQVDASAAQSLRDLLAAAADDGVILGGYGYRTAEDQMALRRQNCPDAVSSDPADCSPPTARVGSSNHEAGLAVDFTWDGHFVSAGDRAHLWLVANAPRFGWLNLPTEAWHFSTGPQAGR